MKDLEPPDTHHFEAAQGWLGLGDYAEAIEELERISPQLRAHPDVLWVRWQIYACAQKWDRAAEVARALTEMVPDSAFGWIHLAYALHEMKRTQEAWHVLLPVADKFPDQFQIPYNLACYASQLGNLTAARQWLERAIDVHGTAEVKTMALNDSDLEPLWAEIGKI